MASTIKVDTIQSTTSNVFFQNSVGTEYARFDSTGVFQLANPSSFAAGTAALPSITATGDTNTGIYFPAADTIAFTEGGAECARFNSSGNFGLGVTPNAWDSTWTAVDLQYGGSIGSGNSGTRSLHIFNNSYASSAGYKFSGTGYASAYYQYAGEHNWRSTAATGVADGAATFTTVLSLAGAGKTLALQGGSSNAGAGISFPATQSASSDANTLDDYEEGTWTPSVGGTATYNSTYTVGFYTKIGRQVTLNFSVQITSLGNGAADRVVNAPFVCSSAINECAGSISYHDGLATSVVYIAPYIAGNTTEVGIVSKTAASTGVGYNNIFNTSGGRIWATLTYIIA